MSAATSLSGITIKGREEQKRYVRELAARVTALAREPRMAAIKRRWRDVNARRRPDRPPVWCNPVGCWKEIIPDAALRCADADLRNLELYFRKLLFKREVDDDTPINDYFKVDMAFAVTPANVWGVDVVREKLAGDGTAWQYKSALETDADFDRLTVPSYVFDARKTAEKVAAAREILGDAMDVRLVPFSGYFNIATLGTKAAELRGLEPLMMDMALKPERTHRLMDIMFQGAARFLDAVEAAGQIVPNTDEAMFLSDPLRPDNVAGPWTLKDCWVAGNSQEFDQVSPDMFDAFLLSYQKRIFPRFGAVSYGCCENLTRKMDRVLEIPNLKIFVCSAWTDLKKTAETVGDRHCVMWRHKATDVVFADDLSSFREKIREQARILSGCYYQVVLRELQTLNGHMTRLREWARLTRDIVGA